MKISACIITKNEEKNIEKCLSSLNALVDEKIVVDTGSTDNTIDIAKKNGAILYNYTWNNNFSDARNYAISKAKGDWIIFLDADEYLYEDSINKFKDIINQCDKSSIDCIFTLLNNLNLSNNQFINSAPVVRAFRNDPNIKYKGAIHEVMVRMDKPMKKCDATADIKIIHTGYSSDLHKQKEKGQRNLELLLIEFKKDPESADICFYISESYMMMNLNKEAIKYAYKVIEYRNSKLFGVYQKNYLNIISCMRILNYPITTIKKVIFKALNDYPDFPDFYLILGDIYKREGRYFDSIEMYNLTIQNLDNVVTSQSSAHLHLIDILFNLGELYYKTNQLKLSITYLIEAIKTDKYHYKTIYCLVKILSKNETSEGIIQFLGKIYDYSNVKDIILLLEASIRTGNGSLAICLFNKIPSKDRLELKSKKAMIDLINKNYEESAREYYDLYLTEFKNEYAINMISIALITKDYSDITKIINLVKPTLKRICDYVLKNKDLRLKNNDIIFEIDIPEIDKLEILNILKVLLKQNNFNDTLLYHLDFKSNNLELLMAEMAFELEKYDESITFFEKYLEGDSLDIADEKLSLIYGKMGESYYQMGQTNMAIETLLKAIEFDHNYFHNYEIAIQICITEGFTDKLKFLLHTAELYFKDSHFVSSLLKGCH